MVIIGITGTNGAGKGTIVEYLREKHGFEHHSVRAFLTNIIEERGLPLNRDSMINVANELRSEHGSAYIIETLYEQAAQSDDSCIIESIRTVGEIEALRAKGQFFLFAVDADPHIRYDRIRGRNSSTDQIEFGEFREKELGEMESKDPNKQNLKDCIAHADFTFNNDDSLDALHDQLDRVIEKIMTIEPHG